MRRKSAPLPPRSRWPRCLLLILPLRSLLPLAEAVPSAESEERLAVLDVEAAPAEEAKGQGPAAEDP